MDNQIKAALRGDKQAQADCTAAGVLLPCPFCGGQAQFVRKDIKTNRRAWCNAVYVRCKVCDSRVGRVLCNDDDSAQDEKAVSAWNTRASTEARENPQALTWDELRKMYDEPVWVVFKADVDVTILRMWCLVENDPYGSLYLTNNLGGRGEFATASDFETEGIDAIYRYPPAEEKQ